MNPIWRIFHGRYLPVPSEAFGTDVKVDDHILDTKRSLWPHLRSSFPWMVSTMCFAITTAVLLIHITNTSPRYGYETGFRTDLGKTVLRLIEMTP